MYDLLFNVPWWIPTVLVIVGAALMVNGNRAQNERVRAAGIAVVLFGVGWEVMSYLVDTPKETCIKQSRAFVQSVVAKNWTAFDAMLDPGVRYRFVGSDWQMLGQERLDIAVKADIDRVGVTSATVSNLTATENNESVTTGFSVLSFQESTMGQPVNSEWQFDWHKTASGRWVITEIRGLRIGTIDVKDIRTALPVK